MKDMGIFIGMGLFFGAIGIFLIMSIVMKCRRCSTAVTAKVVDNALNGDRHNGDKYYPVYEYTYNGTEYSTMDDRHYRSPRYQVGEEVELKIDPNKPREAFFAFPSGQFVVGIVFIMAGLFSGFGWMLDLNGSIFRGLILLTGSGLSLFGVYSISRIMHLSKNCREKVSAFITNVIVIEEQGDDDGGSRKYYPVYKYNYNGQEYNVRSEVSYSRSAYKEGDELMLRINAEKPYEVFDKKSRMHYLSGILFLIFGVMFILCGIFAQYV